MAIIGTFTKGTDGTFTGTLQTLTINVKLKMVASEKSKENSPTHRIFAGKSEVGAAWEKTSKSEGTYYSMKIDDPALTSPLFANLVSTETDGEFRLLWSRPGSAAAK